MFSRLASRCALILSATLLFAPTPFAQSLRLPDMGDPSEAVVGPDDEERMGSEALRWLRAHQAILDDVQLTEYLTAIGQNLTVYADPTAVPYTFFAVRNASINAFALPHNLIGIHTGLLLLTEREDELAGVMAHEIAHVSQRHVVRAIADMQRLALPMAAAMLAGAALATAHPQLGQAAFVGSMAAGAQHQISFTRANEQEADRFGLQFLMKAGFDPTGMQDFFARLERMPQGEARNRVPEMLLTHPRPESRIADAEGRLPTISPSLPRQAPLRDRHAYTFAKARARVLATDDNHALIRTLQTQFTDDRGGGDVAARYTYALALRQAGRYEEAQQQIARLLARDPDRLAFQIESAELALARGDNALAFSRFAAAKRLYPDDFVLAMHYGRALATQGDPQLALRILQPQVRRRPTDPTLQSTVAQAAQRAGDVVTTHTALAEYHAINGEWLPAIEQIELALNQPALSPPQEAQLRARLRQLKAKVPPQTGLSIQRGRP